MSIPLAVFGLGPTELLVVAGLALLLFGNRLPSAMRNMGRGIVEFKKGMQGQDDDEGDVEPKKLQHAEKEHSDKS
jgi:sec-independent protein translocase protein TatA